MSLRELYRTLDAPGANPLKKAHADLNASVRNAYGMSKSADVLGFLLSLNAAVAGAEPREPDVYGARIAFEIGTDDRDFNDTELTVVDASGHEIARHRIHRQSPL